MGKEYLTSRQRVLNAIEHKPLDRMPIDMGMHFSSGISMFAYHNLRKHLGLSTDNIEMIDPVQCLARVDEDIIERFHIDTMLLNPPWENPHMWSPRGEYKFLIPETLKPELLEDGSWRNVHDNQTMTMLPGGFHFDGGWPNYYGMDDETHVKHFAKRAEKIFKETDKFTLYMGFTGYFTGLDMACNMLTDPEAVYAYNEKIYESEEKKAYHLIKEMGGYVQAISLNSDLGTQNGLMCTPQSYDETCAPFVEKICRVFHENSDIKVFLHTCGSMSEAIPTLIQCGVDIINPVQISAEKMEPDMLKTKFGKDITFWGGGVDCQHVLGVATPEEVVENSKYYIDIFKPGGGFVFNPVHNIVGNVPPENVVALYDAAYERSFY